MNKRVVVIGGGILGITAAYHLAGAGYQVTVLEKGEIAGAASGGNLGQLSVLDRDESWHAGAVLESLDVYESLSKTVDVEYAATGGCVVLENQEHVDAAQAALRKVRPLGIDAEILWGKQANRHEPYLDADAVQGIVFCPQEGKINPLLAMNAYTGMARARGVEIHEHTPVTGFALAGGLVQEVLTPGGAYAADVVVNAAGSWAGHVAALAEVTVPIRFHRGTACVSQPVGPVLTGPVVGGGMFLTGRGDMPPLHIGLGAIQTNSGSVIVAQATEEMPVDDKEVSLRGFCGVAQKFLRVFPELAGLQIVRVWAAVTPYTDDQLPMFGFSARVQNFFTCAGFKGAFSIAPAVGRRVVGAVRDGLVWEGGAFSPERTL